MRLSFNLKAFPKTLEKEVSQLGEKFRILYKEDSVSVEFFDIVKQINNEVDDQGNVISETVSFLKKNVAIVDEEEVVTYQEYNFDIVSLNSIMASHDYDKGVYNEKAKELIKRKYSIEEETGLINDDKETPGNQEYAAYRQYVKQCKDKAYLEVYGVERG